MSSSSTSVRPTVPPREEISCDHSVLRRFNNGVCNPATETLFSNAEVQAALNWKYGPVAEYVDVPSVWQLLDAFRGRKLAVARESIRALVANTLI